MHYILVSVISDSCETEPCLDSKIRHISFLITISIMAILLLLLILEDRLSDNSEIMRSLKRQSQLSLKQHYGQT